VFLRVFRVDEDRVRDKRGHEFVGFVYLAVFVFVLRWMHEFGLSQGLPRVSPIVTIAIWIGPLADIAIHELGHALMAWAVGFRVPILSIGPLLVWRDRNGNRSYRFDWSRFLVGGYMGAVPASQRGVRPKFLLILLAGPFAALGASVLLFCVLLKVPGTSWEAYWGIIATCSAWSFADFVANLIPVGNTDGSILLNVLLWTRKGQDHIAKLHGSKEYDQAEDRKGELDFDSEVATRERLLQQALQRSHCNPGELAVHYHKLGGALMRVGRYAEAEEALKKGLETLDQSDEVDTAAQANGWLALHQMYLVRKRAADMDRAYHMAVGPLERLLAKRSSGAEEAQNRKCLATLHRASGRYEVGATRNQARPGDSAGEPCDAVVAGWSAARASGVRIPPWQSGCRSRDRECRGGHASVPANCRG
jgi:Zn-dependent protease